MKLLKTKHRTEVLTGVVARQHLREFEPENHWANAVAKCSCGWQVPVIHGELAEQLAEQHRRHR